MPKVSVLTPLYNTNPKYLREMIESILNQTYKDFEFLILNDSPENMELEKIVKSYNDSRIKYFVNERNIGIAASRNKLLELAKGEYIAIFDHDDISLSQRLEKEVKYLDENSDIGVISCNYRMIGSKKKSNYPTENADIKTDLVVRGCVVPHTGAMIRKSVLIENNVRYEAKYSPSEDYMLWARLIEKTMFHNLKEILVLYRDYKQNTTHKQADKMKNVYIMIKNVLYKEYPFMAAGVSSNSYINVLGIPLIKRKKSGNKIYYKLFGIIPLIKNIK